MKLTIVLLFMLLSLTMTSARAENLAALSKGMSYQEVKTWHQQFLAGNPTRAERLEATREIVRVSPYGERGLNRMFRNFEGSYSIDPRIAGVEDSVRMLTSSSRSQAKGYARELLYAVGLYNDPRFIEIAMNQKLQRPWGNTDADITFRYGKRGIYGRIEVKDVSLNSQATDIKRIKGQIDKMAREYRRTGHLQVWVNRREVLPAIRHYAESKGVRVYEKVSTGISNPNKTMTFNDFMADVDMKAKKVQRTRAIQGGMQLGFGLWMLLDSVPASWSEMQAIMNSDTQNGEAWRRLGEHGSLTLAGGAMTASGGALLSSQYARGAQQGNLYYASRVGGAVSLAALASGEGFMIYRYHRGDVSSREFWTSQWVLGGSAAGGLTGSWIGGTLGGLLSGAVTDGAGTVLGASVGSGFGGLAGTLLGGKTATHFADEYYDWKFAELDRQFADFVYARYGVQ